MPLVTKITLNQALAFVAGGATAIFAAGMFMGPVKAMPVELKEVQLNMRSIDKTVTELNVIVKDLAESIREVRVLRRDFDTFRLESSSSIKKLEIEMEALRKQQ